MPLLAAEHQDVFKNRPQPSWDMLEHVYVALLGRSEGVDTDLMNMAVAMQILYRHSTRPPRQEKAPPLAEVMYFLDMCDFAKSPVRALCGADADGNTALFRFCKYCWRTAIPKRSICPEHAFEHKDGDTRQEGSVDKGVQTPASRRKQASRQKPLFDAAVSKLLTKEVLEFHDSHYVADVLLPGSSRMRWLVKRRPTVAALLSDVGGDETDEGFVESLLKLLHELSGLQGSLEVMYSQVNSIIVQTPGLIWPMLVRAEAWHAVRKDVRQGWGGIRKNAGRPKPSAKQDGE